MHPKTLQTPTYLLIALCVVVFCSCALDFDLESKEACRSDSDCPAALLCIGATPQSDGACLASSNTTVPSDASSDVEDTEQDATRDTTPDTIADVPEDVGDQDTEMDTADTSDVDEDGGCTLDCVPNTTFCLDPDTVAECVLGEDGCPTTNPATTIVCSGEDSVCMEGQCRDDSACVDQDGDLHGEGCALGADCDDTDPTRFFGNTEECDGVDHDCDGSATNTFDLDADIQNCGGCGIVCEGMRATWTCQSGSCAIAACEGGFFDANEDAQDGCEYACVQESVTEAICTDGRDNDCNGLVDGADPACDQTLGLSGPYAGLYLERSTLTGPNGPEETLLTTSLPTRFDTTQAFQSTGWQGSPVLSNGGNAITRNRQKVLESLGMRRFRLSPQEGNTADTSTWRLFASPDEHRSLVLGVRQREGNFAWSDGLVFLVRTDLAEGGSEPAARYTQGVFRGRTLDSDSRAVAAQSTWEVRYEQSQGTYSIGSELGPAGPAEASNRYPLSVILETSEPNEFSVLRGNNGNWSTASVGYSFFQGEGALTALFSSNTCSNNNLRNRACPPEAGWGIFVDPLAGSVESTTLQGRWVLMGTRVADHTDQAGGFVQGNPFFLGVEFRVLSDGRIEGAGEFAWGSDFGTMQPDGADIRLDLQNLSGSGRGEPTSLTLTGLLSRSRNVAVLFEKDTPSFFEQGVYILMRLDD